MVIDMKESINLQLEDHLTVIDKILKNDILINKINEVIDILVDCYKKKNKVLLFGCGGSAADSQHIAAEFINRLNFDRKSLPAIALTTDSSIITAIGNDHDFSKIFSRQVEGLVNEGDIVIGISTSGKSDSVLKGLKKAKEETAITILFTGASFDQSKKLTNIVDHIIEVPSTVTTRIQEAHIIIAHIICSSVEDELFNERT
jgi:D-sedoheptulose 7-phosphate isomerase